MLCVYGCFYSGWLLVVVVDGTVVFDNFLTVVVVVIVVVVVFVVVVFVVVVVVVVFIVVVVVVVSVSMAVVIVVVLSPTADKIRCHRSLFQPTPCPNSLSFSCPCKWRPITPYTHLQQTAVTHLILSTTYIHTVQLR
jgi:hypothetical protein